MKISCPNTTSTYTLNVEYESGQKSCVLIASSLTFAFPPFHSFRDIDSPCLSTVLLNLPSFSNSPNMRSIFSSLISIELRSSVRVIEPPFWAKIQRIRSRWLYGDFFMLLITPSMLNLLCIRPISPLQNVY
jgi:hypothetical protein